MRAAPEVGVLLAGVIGGSRDTSVAPGGRALRDQAMVSKPMPLRRADLSPTKSTEYVYLNKVGTFGASSAGYWWGHAGGANMILGHYMVGCQEAL